MSQFSHKCLFYPKGASSYPYIYARLHYIHGWCIQVLLGSFFTHGVICMVHNYLLIYTTSKICSFWTNWFLLLYSTVHYVRERERKNMFELCCLVLSQLYIHIKYISALMQWVVSYSTSKISLYSLPWVWTEFSWCIWWPNLANRNKLHCTSYSFG